MPALVFPEKIKGAGDAYLQILDRWNSVHSLTALSAEGRFEALLLDSAALFPHLESVPPGSLVADFGSGVGIPAVAIAAHRPDLRVVAIDRSHKKSAFVGQVALELKLGNLSAICSPVESLAPLNANFGTAKAVGSMSLLLKWWELHAAPGAPFFAFKGPKWGASEAGEIGGGWGHEIFPYQLPNLGKRALVKCAKAHWA